MCFKLCMAHHKPQAVQPQGVRPVWVQGAGISGPGFVEGWPEVQSQRPLPQAPSSLQASWMARGDQVGTIVIPSLGMKTLKQKFREEPKVTQAVAKLG